MGIGVGIGAREGEGGKEPKEPHGGGQRAFSNATNRSWAAAAAAALLLLLERLGLSRTRDKPG